MEFRIPSFVYKKFVKLEIRCYNPVFDSSKRKKSLYPIYLLGCSDFFCCHEI